MDVLRLVRPYIKTSHLSQQTLNFYIACNRFSKSQRKTYNGIMENTDLLLLILWHLMGGLS